MSNYTDSLSRGTAPSYTAGANGVAALIPEDVSREIVKGTTQKSAALSMFKHRTMSTAQQRMPVLANKPAAFWVSGDTGLKQTTSQAWKNKFLDAEELAVIIPVPEKVLDDVDYDLWAEIKPEIEEAIAVALDKSVFFGINKPASWPGAISVTAINVGNTYTEGSGGAGTDIADDINEVMKLVEADGYDVNGFWIQNTMKGQLRGLRSTEQGFIFMQGMPGLENTVYKGSIYGEKVVVSMSGVFQDNASTNPTNPTKLIAGDWNQGLIGVRQDMTWKLLTEAVLQDDEGRIVYNLPQQDMVAMRVVCRYAFQVPNPINRINTQEADAGASASGDRYPFAVLRSA